MTLEIVHVKYKEKQAMHRWYLTSVCNIRDWKAVLDAKRASGEPNRLQVRLAHTRSSPFTKNRSCFIDILRLFLVFIQIECKNKGTTAAVRSNRYVSDRTLNASGTADPEFKGKGSCLRVPPVCVAGHGGYLNSLKWGEVLSSEEFLLLNYVIFRCLMHNY